jgi:GxxExxY protein
MNSESALSPLLHADITEPVIGAFYEVYNALGFGFLEIVYQRAMVVALRKRGLHVELEAPYDVLFDSVQCGHHEADLVVERRVLLELKATYHLTDADRRKVLNYLRASKLEVSPLLHFGPAARFERIVFTTSMANTSMERRIAD